MNDKAASMVLASFTADSLALGAHWIYDTNEITNQFGLVDKLIAPLPTSYHQHKQQGDFTHYGDQAFTLLTSLSQHNGFDLQAFSTLWQQLFADYNGYIDTATKTTLANLQKNGVPESCGSSSTDLGGAARIAPLVFWYQNDQEHLVEAATQQTSMTHNHPATISGAVFIARSAYNILHGLSPVAAMEEALNEGVNDLDLDNRIRSALDTQGKETEKVIKDFGQACTIASALPGAVHLVVKYENDLQAALIANVMAGGDSAARGLTAGMLLGAYLGSQAIPNEWLTGLNKHQQLLSLLKQEKRG